MQPRWEPEVIAKLAARELTPADAQEAIDDPDAIWFEPDPTSKSGESDRVVGYSPSQSEILCVILVHFQGAIYGGNAWRANSKFRRIYREGLT